MVCARCQRPFPTGQPAHAASICDDGIELDEPAAAMAAAAPPLRGDDWSSRQRARNLARELRRPHFATTQSKPRGAAYRFDPPQHLFAELRQIEAPGVVGGFPHQLASNRRPRGAEGQQITAWLIVAIGAIGLAAGIGLVAWSLNTGRMMHWNLALGLTLGGQGTLILGLVLAVSRLWRSSRYAAQRLQDVHVRLAQLQHTADALTATRAGGAPAFYADLVRGASPHVMLANLKGQVDQLATRLSGIG
jgi:hypothetical protein